MMDAKAIANGTLAALEAGQYTAPDGATIAIRELLATCVSNTRYYEPDDLDALYQQVVAQPGNLATTFAVVNETALQACARLVASQQFSESASSTSLRPGTLAVASCVARVPRRKAWRAARDSTIACASVRNFTRSIAPRRPRSTPTA